MSNLNLKRPSWHKSWIFTHSMVEHYSNRFALDFMAAIQSNYLPLLLLAYCAYELYDYLIYKYLYRWVWTTELFFVPRSAEAWCSHICYRIMGGIGLKMVFQRYTSPLVFEFYHHKFRHTHIGYEISSDIIYDMSIPRRIPIVKNTFYMFHNFFMVADLLSPNRCHW